MWTLRQAARYYRHGENGRAATATRPMPSAGPNRCPNHGLGRGRSSRLALLTRLRTWIDAYTEVDRSTASNCCQPGRIRPGGRRRPAAARYLAGPDQARPDDPGRPARAGAVPAPVLVVLAAAVACVRGIYGIGGESIPAPALIGTGRRPSEVAPATLASTMVTSIAGLITFVILLPHEPGSVAPDWDTGLALGVGGLAGAYTRARLQSRLPDTLIRRLVGIVVIAIGIRYLWPGLS